MAIRMVQIHGVIVMMRVMIIYAVSPAVEYLIQVGHWLKHLVAHPNWPGLDRLMRAHDGESIPGVCSLVHSRKQGGIPR